MEGTLHESGFQRNRIGREGCFNSVVVCVADDLGDIRIQEGLAIAVDGSTSHLGLIEPVSDTTEVHFIPAIGGG